MPRFTIAGFRAGETIETPAGRVRLHANDGAAELTSAQLAYFKESGLKTAKAADEPPETVAAAPRPGDDEIAKALKRGEEQVKALHSVPTPPAA